jgi:hypothetical protein
LRVVVVTAVVVDDPDDPGELDGVIGAPEPPSPALIESKNMARSRVGWRVVSRNLMTAVSCRGVRILACFPWGMADSGIRIGGYYN